MSPTAASRCLEISRSNEKLTDLLMMVVCPGRERTEQEFRDLYTAAGLRLTRVVPTPSSLSIVEGIPA